MAKKKFYLDMEFNQRNVGGHTVFEMISIGLIDEDGRTYYAVSNEFNLKAAQENQFVNDVVLPRLGLPQTEWKSKDQIRQEVLDFIGCDEKNQALIHYWWIPHDFMLLSDLLGEGDFMNMPPQIDRIGVNVAQTWKELGSPHIKLSVDSDEEHNALVDAIWLKEAHEKLLKLQP